ncbi:MAG: hypothetical protein ACAI35_17370 [Candidatus Methylacidiphilales bacterium]
MVSTAFFSSSATVSRSRHFPRRNGAFTLAEVVLALGVTAFCAVTLIGLFTVGVTTNMQAGKETQAATIVQTLMVTRRASPAADLTSAQPRFPLPPMVASSVTPAAGKLVYVDANGLLTADAATAQFGLTYFITSTPEKPGTQLHLILHWPAQAAAAKAAGIYEILSYFPPQ